MSSSLKPMPSLVAHDLHPGDSIWVPDHRRNNHAYVQAITDDPRYDDHLIIIYSLDGRYGTYRTFQVHRDALIPLASIPSRFLPERASQEEAIENLFEGAPTGKRLSEEEMAWRPFVPPQLSGELMDD